MSSDEFDSGDLEALRRMKDALAPAGDKRDGRRLRSPSGGARRDVQMNTRVRREIKEQAYEIARMRRSTIAEVIERAIERFYAEQIAQSQSEPQR